MTRPVLRPPRKNPILRTRVPTLPPGSRSRIAQGLTAAAARGEFELQVCRDCGTVQYPPREACHKCLSHRLDWRVQDGAGELVSETTLHHSNELFYRERVPWRLGVVKLDAGPVVVAHLHGDCPQAPSRVHVRATLDKAGQAALIAVPQKDTPNMADDRQLREMTCDPKFRKILITDAKTALGQALVEAIVAAGADLVWAGYAEPWKKPPGFERLSKLPQVALVPLDLTDSRAVKNLAGVVKVVVNKNFVGVVAEKPWQAIQAASQLKVTWSAGAGLPSHATFYAHMRTQPARDALAVDSKDVEERLAAAATVLKATYLHPYQMHGSMGSSCAVADVEGEKATVWSPTQGVWYQKSTVAMLLGLKPENVHVIFRRGSGCYGLNGADTVTYDAAILSQAVGKPVRVQLSRKDAMAWENYGNAYVIDERAGLDAQGNIIAWDHESWSPTRGNRPGPGTPGNVVTGFLAGFSPQPFTPRSPAPSPTAYNNNANAVPSYVAGNVGGRDQGTGTVKSERVLTHTIESPFWTGPLRSPNRLQNTFAHECFLDELAAHTKADPVEYRLRHLRDPRLIAVVNEVAKAANWEVRPSPKPAARKTGVVTGRGMASVLYEGDNGYSALVAEVEVNQDTGRISVKRFVCAADCGPISNPDGLRNQMEGGALQGLSRALMEEVTWDDQKVTSFDWRTYHTLPLGFDVPKVEAVLLNRPDQEATGAGETSITVVAAALGNAIFDATGARIRQIPFTPERVKAALVARG